MADATYTGKVGAAGTATITVQTRSMRAWEISQISVELAAAPTGATADIRKNGYLVTPVIPTGDTAAGDPPVRILPTDSLTINWYGCTNGQIAKATVFYEEK
jgi:hypothetical protein